MKFNIVIGNPPYNRGSDIDFVDLSYTLSSDYVCMITPAKWQTADDSQSINSRMGYGDFRKRYVSHMRYICFYPCCKDIFLDILQVDGITWYLMDKYEHNKCIVENRCKYIEYFNNIEIRDIKNRETLVNIGNEIINYLEPYEKFRFKNKLYKRYQVWTNIKIPGGGLSTIEETKKTYFLGVSKIIDTFTTVNDLSDVYRLTFAADTEFECISFISWLNCKFTRFFLCINTSKLTGIPCDDCFRFVPAPVTERFDHIYTDKELYDKFKLPYKYVEVIESIVKERDGKLY